MGDIKERVSEFYGKTVSKTEDLRYSACNTDGYNPADIEHITKEVLDKRYGCESPIPELLDGLTLVDLGSGAGIDCFIVARKVGENGHVIGVDMTPEMLEISRRNISPILKNLGYTSTNIEFREGYLEKVPVDDNSVDVVISNCVINLSSEKDKVFQEIWRILKPNGSFFVSDIVSDRRIPESFDKDPRLHSECYTGASYKADYLRIMRDAGFNDVRQFSCRSVEEVINDVHFESVIFRGFKIALEDTQEDYGQEAVYKGTISNIPDKFKLDKNNVFPTGESKKVCKNTADILTKSRFSPHFDLSEEKFHTGPFTGAPDSTDEDEVPKKSSCC